MKRVEKQRKEKLKAEGLWFEDDEEEADDPLIAEFDEEDGATKADDDPGAVNKD